MASGAGLPTRDLVRTPRKPDHQKPTRSRQTPPGSRPRRRNPSKTSAGCGLGSLFSVSGASGSSSRPRSGWPVNFSRLGDVSRCSIPRRRVTAVEERHPLLCGAECGRVHQPGASQFLLEHSGKRVAAAHQADRGPLLGGQENLRDRARRLGTLSDGAASIDVAAPRAASATSSPAPGRTSRRSNAERERARPRGPARRVHATRCARNLLFHLRDLLGGYRGHAVVRYAPGSCGRQCDRVGPRAGLALMRRVGRTHLAPDHQLCSQLVRKHVRAGARTTCPSSQQLRALPASASPTCPTYVRAREMTHQPSTPRHSTWTGEPLSGQVVGAAGHVPLGCIAYVTYTTPACTAARLVRRQRWSASAAAAARSGWCRRLGYPSTESCGTPARPPRCKVGWSSYAGALPATRVRVAERRSNG